MFPDCLIGFSKQVDTNHRINLMCPNENFRAVKTLSYANLVIQDKARYLNGLFRESCQFILDHQIRSLEYAAVHFNAFAIDHACVDANMARYNENMVGKATYKHNYDEHTLMFH